MSKVAWSFSSLKTFQQCPKKYYHTKVAKDVVEPDTQATLYGKAVHTAAEEFIRDGIPVPEKYGYVAPMLEQLNEIPGVKHCEYKMGLREDLTPCDFAAPDVWWRGIADLLIIDEEEGLAYSLDYKTSKSARYADTKQLDLIAVAIFAHFPKIKKVKSALAFVVSKEFVKAQHYVEMVPKYIEKPRQDVARLEAALDNGVWNPIQGPLCRFCSVKQCEYNRE
jgi:hypothetical protein